MSDSFSTVDADPRRVSFGLWVRRAIMTVLALVVLAALLNRFGQRPTESVARGGKAVLRLSAPERVRGGLFFQSRVDVRAIAAIDQPTIVLDEGWTEGMQVNSIEPAAVDEGSRDGRVELTYDSLDGGDLLRVWFQFEVNPTNVGRRSYSIELDDGERPLARISRTITSLP